MPFIPFNLLNYILGITGIKIKIYFLTTIICIAPGTIAFTWIGAASRHVIEGQRENNWIELSLISIAAVATVVFLPKLIRRYLSLR